MIEEWNCADSDESLNREKQLQSVLQKWMAEFAVKTDNDTVLI